MKWVISVNNMVCPLLLIPGKKGKKHDKIHKNYNHKKYKKYKKYNKNKKKETLLNLMIFMLKRKMFLKDMINKDQEKANVLIVVNLDTTVKIANKNLVS